MSYVPARRSDGTVQQRRVPLPWPGDQPFRILSIDGGGIRGILPASILAELESRFLGGRSIVSYFDMVAGTSTGGIIALGLARGLTARDVQTFYLERGGAIFPPLNQLGRVRQWMRRWHHPIHNSAALEDELLRVFGDTVLGEARIRACIPSFEGVYGEPWIYKTPHHPDYKKDKVERMVHIARATSAAPTYYSALRNTGYTMVDGGLWANNPVMNVVVDALACFDVRRDQVQVLSLGCGSSPFRIDAAKARGGILQWTSVIDAAMRAQSHNALGQAYLLLGKPNVVRLDAPDTDVAIMLDDYLAAKALLPNVARALVEGSGHHVASMFLTKPVVPFTPVA